MPPPRTKRVLIIGPQEESGDFVVRLIIDGKCARTEIVDALKLSYQGSKLSWAKESRGASLHRMKEQAPNRRELNGFARRFEFSPSSSEP